MTLDSPFGVRGFGVCHQAGKLGLLILGADSGPEPWPLVMILNSAFEADRPKTGAFLAPNVGQHVRSVEGKRATCLISVANSTARGAFEILRPTAA